MLLPPRRAPPQCGWEGRGMQGGGADDRVRLPIPNEHRAPGSCCCCQVVWGAPQPQRCRPEASSSFSLPIEACPAAVHQLIGLQIGKGGARVLRGGNSGGCQAGGLVARRQRTCFDRPRGPGEPPHWQVDCQWERRLRYIEQGGSPPPASACPPASSQCHHAADTRPAAFAHGGPHVPHSDQRSCDVVTVSFFGGVLCFLESITRIRMQSHSDAAGEPAAGVRMWKSKRGHGANNHLRDWRHRHWGVNAEG